MNNSKSIINDHASEIGRKLRKRRKELGLTMQFVADNAGLSVGFISQVERCITAPSLGSLVMIAKTLKMPVSELLEQPHSSGQITRQENRETYAIDESTLSYERISDSFPGNVLNSVIVHELPGHCSEPMSHEGEELIYVLNGSLTVTVDDVVTVLIQGDSIHFSSSKKHTTWNHTDKPTTLLWCGTMDIFGEQDAPNPTHRQQKKLKSI